MVRRCQQSAARGVVLTAAELAERVRASYLTELREYWPFLRYLLLPFSLCTAAPRACLKMVQSRACGFWHMTDRQGLAARVADQAVPGRNQVEKPVPVVSARSTFGMPSRGSKSWGAERRVKNRSGPPRVHSGETFCGRRRKRGAGRQALPLPSINCRRTAYVCRWRTSPLLLCTHMVQHPSVVSAASVVVVLVVSVALP